MTMRTEIVLIRHASSAPDPAVPEPDWPLSADGVAQARDLAQDPSLSTVTRIFTSPFLRARDTVAPLAARLDLPVRVHEDLRERCLSPRRLDDWSTQLERSWRDFDHALPGGESSRQCQARVTAALHEIVAEAEGHRIALASHGNAISLFLHGLDGRFGFEDWAAMRNPDLFEVEWRAGHFRRLA